MTTLAMDRAATSPSVNAGDPVRRAALSLHSERFRGLRRRVVTVCATAITAMLTTTAALAGTNVSGPITSNTTWSTANAPYTVTGDVTIDSGAVLTVQPGVTVFMNAATNLIVKNGGLLAQGTSVSPIVITSFRDIANPNPAPAPGDWGQLKFQSGTIAGSTQLTNVAINYGSGVALTAASPTLNSVSILNHNAAAITTDLQSSPVGSGLVATGNTLNGILVPAGDITGSVTWGLTGIPYVVAQGIVGVGAPPIAISPSLLTLNAGTNGVLHVTVANAAPAGGLALNVASGTTSVATVPATVTVPQNATTVDVTVTAVAVGSSVITVSGSGLGSATATAQVNAAPTLALSPALGNVGIGQTLPMTVTASTAAPSGGLAVTLSSSNSGFVSVPTPVTIAANGTSANFNATGVAAGAAAITAQAAGYANGSATITAQTLALGVPANLLVAPGLTVGLTATLSAPAPAGGVTVNFHSANTAIATVPASVNVAAGATTAGVNVTGVAAGSTTVTASATGYTSGNTTVAVSAITLDVQPTGTISIPQGVTQTYLVRLSAAAPVGGVTVNVTSNGTSTASVSPSSVTIAQGQTLSVATISVQGLATGSTTLTLSSPGLNAKTVNVSVLGPGNLAFNTSPVVLGKSLMISATDSVYRVSLFAGSSLFGNPAPVTVTLTSSDPSKVTVSPTVTIPAGNGFAKIQLAGVDFTSAPISITASAPGYQSTVTPLSATVVAPTILFLQLDSNRVTNSPRDSFQVRWSVPDNNNSAQTSSADTALDLTVTNQNPAGIVTNFYDALTGGNTISQITVSAGQNQSGTAYVGQPTVAGTYTVTASVPGVATGTSFVQTATVPTLQLPSSVAITAGLTTASTIANGPGIALSRTGDVSAPLTVTLSCTPASACTVPATVTIPAANSFLYVPVTGVAVGSGTLSASAAGYTSTSSIVNVEALPRYGSGAGGSFRVGGTVNITITLQSSTGTRESAPTDIVLTITSSSPAVATVPATATISAGGSGSVSINMLCLSPGTTTISWTTNGFGPGSVTPLTVTP